MKDVDFGERTSLFDHVCLGCTQRECQTSKKIVTNYRDMFESRISAGDQKQESQGSLLQKQHFRGLMTVCSQIVTKCPFLASSLPRWSALVSWAVEAWCCGALRSTRGADQRRSPNRRFLGIWGPVGFWEENSALHDGEC